MTSCPTPSEPDDRAAQREVDTAYYRAMLHELADMGMDIARAVAGQAAQETTAQPESQPAPTQPAADPTIAFERIARTIRRTVALVRTLDEPARPAPSPRAEKAAAPHHRVAARARIIREVEDVIQRKAEGAEADSLRDELYERLQDAADTLDDDLAHQPVAEVIQILLRDLGLAAAFPGTRPWRRRTPAEVRDLCARAARLAGVEPPARPTPDQLRAAPMVAPAAAPPPWPPRPTTPPARPTTGPPP